MNYNTQKEIANEFNNSGIYKSGLPVIKLMILAVLGGAFIAIGGLLTVVVAGGMPEVQAANPGLVRLVAGVIFPVGLIMVSIAGADLFTSNCAGMTFSCLQRQVSVSSLLKVWILSYIFNFIGAQLIAYFLTHEVGLVASGSSRDYLHGLAESKVYSSFGTVFLKGLAANWLVCLGVWMGFAGKDIIGKSIGIWVPIMIFVTLGYEHSIANMFFIPAAIYSGADISWWAFLADNLLPATLGNIIGGAVFVGCIYWYVYLRK